MKDIVKWLTDNNKYISTMESCTGGFIANSITNIEGASLVFKYGAVTYSNEFKIKMGVSSKIIDTYSVYSEECAKDMAKSISLYTGSNYGVGVTGKFNRIDPNNLVGNDNTVFVSIYNNDNDEYICGSILVSSTNREQNKEEVLAFVIEKINEMIKKG